MITVSLDVRIVFFVFFFSAIWMCLRSTVEIPQKFGTWVSTTRIVLGNLDRVCLAGTSIMAASTQMKEVTCLSVENNTN